MEMADSHDIGTDDALDRIAPKTVGWRYPPFLTAFYGQVGPKDGVNLSAPAPDPTVTDEPDFAFDWHVSFAPISPVKAALVRLCRPCLVQLSA